MKGPWKGWNIKVGRAPCCLVGRRLEHGGGSVKAGAWRGWNMWSGPERLDQTIRADRVTNVERPSCGKILLQVEN